MRSVTDQHGFRAGALTRRDALHDVPPSGWPSEFHRCAAARPVIRLAIALAVLLVATPAWAQTPTLVQHYYTGTNAPHRGLPAASYTFRLPNTTLAGNCLVLFLDYTNGVSVSSITDDGGNAWPSAAVTADSGAGNAVSAVFVLPNVIGGTRAVTITFSAAIAGVHAVFLEYANVDPASPVGSTAFSITTSSPTISSGTLAPAPAAPGSLVLHYSMDNVGAVGDQSATPVSAWSAGSGWTLLGGDINNAHDTSSFALQARVADGTDFAPTVLATQAVRDTFNSLVVELKAAAAGTLPPPGIRILKQQFYVNTHLSAPGSWTEFFPAQGNLLVATNIFANSTVSPISDSNGNTWTPAHTDPGAPALQYAQNPTVSSTLAVSIPLTNATTNTTITLYDIIGAATSSVFAQAVTPEGPANSASVINQAPSITPLHQNGLIIVTTALQQGPATGFASGAPASAFFMPVTYPGETDFDTFDNAAGYAHNYYGTNLAQQSYNWTIVPRAGNAWSAVAVEFISDDGSLPVAPILTATAASSSQINLTWTAASDVAVTSYLVERCQGPGCSTFTQIAAVTGLAFSDSGLASSTSYSYRVRATDAAGNLGAYSNIASAATLAAPDTTPPSAPSALTATAASSSQITLAWTAATDDVAVTSYLVERCQGPGCSTFTQIAAVTGTTFNDTGLAASTSYAYRVRATDAAGNLGAYSNSAAATTSTTSDTTPPSAPSALTATAASSSQITLAWTAATDDAAVTGYLVERCQDPGCSTFTQIAAVTGTTFNDTGLTASTSYAYRIRATDAAGNLGPYSNSAAATTSTAGDTTPPSAPAALTASVSSQAPSNPTGGTVLAASTFNDPPENPLSEGGAWAPLVTLSPNGGRMQKSGGMAFGTLQSPDHGGARTTVAMPNDQYSEIVVGAVNPAQGNVGPIVRVQPTGATTDSHYLWWVGAANHALYRIDANGSAYGATPLAFATSSAGPGDTTRLIARGSAIYGTLNGTRVVFAWDSTYPSGQTGILSFPGSALTDSQINAWNAGDQPALAAGSGSGSWDSSSFTGPNETQQSGIDEGDRWYPADLTATVGPVWRVANAAVGSQAGNHNIAGNWNIIPPATQYAQVTLGTVTSGGGGPMVRMTRGAHTGYLLFINRAAPSSSGIYKWTGGNTFTLLQSFTPARIQTGDKWALYATGSSLDVKLNGVSVGAPFPITDSAFPTGDVGFDLFSNVMTFTAWEGGDINGLTQINLAWTPSTDDVAVTGYLVERCQGPGCSTFTQIASPSGPAYSDAALAPATTYAYRVRATDAAGNLGAYSNTASATTPAAPDTTPPTAPSALTATAASASLISLAWTAATDDVAVTSYLVERCQGPGCSTFTQIAAVTGLAFSDSGLASSTSYSYRVRATDAAGNLGAYSNIASAATLAAPDTTPPSAPSALTATAASSSQITLAWTAATDDVAVTSYLVERCQGPGCSTFTQIAAVTGTTFNDTGLAASTSYAYRVRATDAAGNLGAYSNSAAATTSTTSDTTPPSAPSALTATAASSSQITLAWTAATDDAAVTGYLVERCQGPGCSTFTQIAAVTGTTFNDTGLTASTSYAYRIRATDAAGNLGPYSNTASATTAAPPDTTPPTAPSALTATAISSSQITLAWTGATDNVGVTGYRVERCQGSGCSTFTQIASVTGTTFSNTGLAAGTTYAYRVRATDAAGNLGQYSNSAFATTSDTTAPTAPSGLTAAAISASQINLSWTASTDNVGVAGYLVERCQGSGCSSFTQIATVTGPTYSNTGLTSATTYRYRVRATDAAGNRSTYSNIATATTVDITPPSAPSALIATAKSQSQISLAWVAATDNVGVTGYQVERCQGSGCTSFTQVSTVTGTTYNNTGLAAGTSYTYRVRATDAAGNLSGYSNSATATTPDTSRPSAPSTLTATPASSSQINLAWTASTDNVGVTGYLVERCQGSGCLTFVQIATVSGTTFSNTGLTTATTYRYRVRATDAAGNLSSYSNTATATTPDTTPPSAPSALTATATSQSQISLAWTAATDDVAVTGYRVERCQGSGCTTFTQVASVTGTTYSNTGLAAGTSYTYRVRATDAAGNLSGYSNTATASTPDTSRPTAPSTLTATAASSSQINLAWTASTDNVGVTGYLVERCQGSSCSNFTQIATVTGTTYSNTGLASATNYRYRIRATDAAGNLSTYSNTATTTTRP